MKLSYLHPNRFSVNTELVESYVGKAPYCLIRLSRLTAYHDIGITGLTSVSVNELILLCQQYGRNVFISSEGNLSPLFEHYQLHIDPSDIHHLLAGADLLISDSQSMSVEAAMLGVPSLRFSDFVGRISVLEELEHTYHLTYGITTSNPEKLLRLTKNLLSNPDIKEQTQKLQKAMIATKIDVAAFVTWFVESYPASLKVMQYDSDYQYRFQQIAPDTVRAKTDKPLRREDKTRDFTFRKYKELLSSLKEAGYEFRTFESFCEGNNKGRYVMLRHDVDLLPSHSVQCAEIEAGMDIHSSYYFRIVNKSNHPESIRSIVKMGHELGYHYEVLSASKGNYQQAIQNFKKNLSYFRNFYPVRTISMHGSPTSRYDNRDMWKEYDYHTWDVIGEPYFDIDYRKVMYLTDTGHCWNGQLFNIRDKVAGNSLMNLASTDDIILAAKQGLLPDKIMINTHPQRWTDNKWEWWTESTTQWAKNQAKRVVVRFNRHNKSFSPENAAGYLDIDNE